MKAPLDAARLLRESNPVPDDAFAGAAGDRLGRATFERIIDRSAEPAQVAARSPRRWWVRRSAAGVAAALAAGAVAVVAVVLPGAGAGGPQANAAYVVKRVDTALRAAGPGEIAQMTVTTRILAQDGKTGTSTAEVWSYGDQWRSVTNSPGGHPVLDQGFSTASGYTAVIYPERTVTRQPQLGQSGARVSAPDRCGPSPIVAFPLLPALPLVVQPGSARGGVATSALPLAGALRTAISCGTLNVAGRQRVDGIEAIKLTSTPDNKIPVTIWVSPGTYLPVRMVVRPVPGNPLVVLPAHEAVLRQTVDITWLRPTGPNLAELTVPAPAGFRQVRSLPRPFPLKQVPKSG